MPEVRNPQAKQIQAARTLIAQQRNQDLSLWDNPLPIGVAYPTVVIDPPWPIQKIKRDCRPNQVLLDYPTMTLANIASLPIGLVAGPTAHLFVWTTQKFLFRCEDLILGWGFKPVFTMVWDKGGGYQPIGLAQYSHEFIVYARRGGAKFVSTKDFKTCFSAPRQGHSVKPTKFYETIARVCPGPRLDMFSRQRRSGFESWGNEAPEPLIEVPKRMILGPPEIPGQLTIDLDLDYLFK